MGAVSLSGCLSSNPFVADAEFQYTPPNPVVGEDIVFDGGASNSADLEWFFDTSPGLINMDATGERVVHSFSEPGAHTVTLRASAPLGFIPGPNLDETTKTVYVEERSNEPETPDESITVSTDRVSLQLRGVQTRIGVDETAILQLSAANLNGEQPLSLRLVIKPPSGINVQGTTNVDSGTGQYARSLELAPGESAGVSVELQPTRTGRFEVIGIADYAFDGEDESTRTGMIPIIVTDE